MEVKKQMCKKQELSIVLKDGMELYVEYYDVKKENTVLLIHGGPGESCLSFSYFAALLSQYMNVVTLDQRGVMRSKAEYCDDKLTIKQLIEDFEEVRNILNIPNWHVLGHSFGGYIAMRYVLLYPQSICGVIYENPCFDIKHSLHEILERYIEYYKNSGEQEKEQTIVSLLDINDVIIKFDGIIALPDIDRKRVFKSEAITLKCREFFDKSMITNENIRKCIDHYNVIKYDESLRSEYLSKMKTVECPSLLIHGEMDPMLPLEDKMQWLMNPHNSEITVNGAGHYVHSDTPEFMLELVNDFICKEVSGGDE